MKIEEMKPTLNSIAAPLKRAEWAFMLNLVLFACISDVNSRLFIRLPFLKSNCLQQY